MQQPRDSAQTSGHPTQLALLEHRLQPTPPLTGQGGPAVHCALLYVLELELIQPHMAQKPVLRGALCTPRGVNLNLTLTCRL